MTAQVLNYCQLINELWYSFISYIKLNLDVKTKMGFTQKPTLKKKIQDKNERESLKFWFTTFSLSVKTKSTTASTQDLHSLYPLSFAKGMGTLS